VKELNYQINRLLYTSSSGNIKKYELLEKNYVFTISDKLKRIRKALEKLDGENCSFKLS